MPELAQPGILRYAHPERGTVEISTHLLFSESSRLRSNPMVKISHEIRDPIHIFIRVDSDERKVIDSRPVQRLRHIHQLALTSLLYPGATHKRFEHCLGVMEVASRIFDVVTNPQNLTDEIRQLMPDINYPSKVDYWRRVVRMAALCHDIGHLPFSHAAEHVLLPKDWNHERISRQLILSDEMQAIWTKMTPPLVAEQIAKLAVGPEKAKDVDWSNWEAVLSEIIVGDAFGADRIDYLLRDSHHAGVAYGKFDHYRMIDSLRILRQRRGVGEPALGVEEGGIHSAEALLLARFFMYRQVYMHPVRRIYDIHLIDFLKEWLPGHKFPTDTERHLAMTDNEVYAALSKAASDPRSRHHELARRIMCRDHYREIYRKREAHAKLNLDPGTAVAAALRTRFGQKNVRHDSSDKISSPFDFPVQGRDGEILSSLEVSETLKRIPRLAHDVVYISHSLQDKAGKWLATNLKKILTKKVKRED